MRLVLVRTVVAAVLAALALAGCAAPTPGPTTDDAARVTAPAGLAFADCDGHVGVVDVDSDAATRFMPAGFRPAHLLRPEAPSASLWMMALSCERPATDPLQVLLATVLAQPPNELRNETRDDEGYAVLLAAWTDDADLGAALASWGIVVSADAKLSNGATMSAGVERTGEVEARNASMEIRIRTEVASIDPRLDLRTPAHNRLFVADLAATPPVVRGAVDLDTRFPARSPFGLGAAEATLTGADAWFTCVPCRGVGVEEWHEGPYMDLSFVEEVRG